MSTTPLVSRNQAQKILPGKYFGITNVVGVLRFLRQTTFVRDNIMFSRGVPYSEQTLQSAAAEYSLVAVPRLSWHELCFGSFNDWHFAPNNNFRSSSVAPVEPAHWVMVGSNQTPLMPFLEYQDMAQMVNAVQAHSLPTLHELATALVVGAIDAQEMEKASSIRDDHQNVSIMFCLDTRSSTARPCTFTIDWVTRVVSVDVLHQRDDEKWYDEENFLARATDFSYVLLP